MGIANHSPGLFLEMFWASLWLNIILYWATASPPTFQRQVSHKSSSSEPVLGLGLTCSSGGSKSAPFLLSTSCQHQVSPKSASSQPVCGLTCGWLAHLMVPTWISAPRQPQVSLKSASVWADLGLTCMPDGPKSAPSPLSKSSQRQVSPKSAG